MTEKCVATMNAFGYALGRDFVCHPALHELPACVSDRERVRELCQHHIPVYVDAPSPDTPNAARIVMTPGTIAGAARIDGTRVSVRAVLAAVGGVSVGDVQKAYPQLTMQQIEAALDFATEFIEAHAVAPSDPPASAPSRTDAVKEAIALAERHHRCGDSRAVACIAVPANPLECQRADLVRPVVAALADAEHATKEAERIAGAMHHDAELAHGRLADTERKMAEVNRDSVELRALWNAARSGGHEQALDFLRAVDARGESFDIIAGRWVSKDIQRTQSSRIGEMERKLTDTEKRAKEATVQRDTCMANYRNLYYSKVVRPVETENAALTRKLATASEKMRQIADEMALTSAMQHDAFVR